MFIMMSSVLRKFSSSLKPVYVVSLTRLVSTSSCQLVSDSGVHSSDGTIISPNRLEDRSNALVDTHQEQSSYESDVKNKILEASLQFVSVHGWTKDAISAGAETLGYPGVIHGMFPRGGFDLIQHFYITSNKKLVEFLIKEYQASAPSDDKEMKSDGEDIGRRQKIEKAVKVRLEMIQPYMKEWPQALAIMSLPPNVPTSLASLLCLVDDIFYYTGDKSVDLSWYTRRVVLAGIYKATELYMLQDNSVQYMNTWEFLHRRMDEASQVRSYMKASEQASQVAKEFATSAFITARSILGLSWKR